VTDYHRSKKQMGVALMVYPLESALQKGNTALMRQTVSPGIFQ
jgi:hypothetical protein